MAQLFEQCLIVTRLGRQSRPYCLFIKTGFFYVHGKRRMIGHIEHYIETRLICRNSGQYHLVKIFIIASPDTSRSIGGKIATAIKIIIALSLHKGTNSFPGRRPCIPKISMIAQLRQLWSTCCRICRGKGFRHCGQIEIRIGKAGNNSRNRRNRTGPIRKKRLTVSAIRFGNNRFHPICNMKFLVFVEQRPIRIALANDQKNLLWLFYCRSLRFFLQIIIKI